MPITVHELSPGVPAGTAPTVLLAHGITANGLAWRLVGEELRRRHGHELRVLAPDLRGRAESRHIGPPWGLGAHVDDLVALAREQDGPVVLAGHSMGAFVAALAMATHAADFAGAVLVDGGLAFEVPEDTDVDAALQAVIGPAMTRLAMRFDDEQKYLDFWADHPAVGPLLTGATAEAARDWLLHDLIPSDSGDGLVSSCVLDAIRTDGGAVLLEPPVRRAVADAAAAGARMELLWAARGMLDEDQGLYDEDRLAALAVPASVPLTRVDANHYSIIVSPTGVAAVCDAIDRML